MKVEQKFPPERRDWCVVDESGYYCEAETRGGELRIRPKRKICSLGGGF